MQKLKPTASLFFDDRHAKKSNTYPVKLTVYFSGEKKRYKTKIDVTEEQWKKMNSDKLRDDDLKLLKRKLGVIVERAEKVFEKLEAFSFNAFEDAFFDKKEDKKSLDLGKYFDKYIEQLEAEGRIGNAISNRTTKNSLLEFKAKLKLTDITPEFLKAYENHMKIKGSSPSTIGIYLRTLRAIVNRAINDKLIKAESYPFKNYSIPSARNIKKALNEEELKKVLEFKPVQPGHEKALDFWILTYLCNGMNMTDLLLLRHENIDGDFMHFFRAKTINTKKKDLRPLKVFLTDKAKAIIAKWQSRGDRKTYLFPVLEDGLTPLQIKHRVSGFLKFVNKHMKEVGEELKINKPMGTYTARHTHATVLKRKGVPTAAIAENLGHSSLLTTENYLDSFTDDIKKEYAKLLVDI
jgi:integrase/recombinase XerD